MGAWVGRERVEQRRWSKGKKGEGRDVEGLATMLHGQLEQNLVDGQLPLDPKGKEVWKPWKDDPPSSPCIHYQNRLGVGIAPVRLVSFPCSGNTWLRYLVESATGVFTGAVYNDKRLYEGGE
ncbi:hypothetical protein Pcinc_030888 [Petrolisthes cinctipes]|uniref:Uncharacterized protein n=1 Tax=Petrolisthes cinctipes TaxID=88211 RepID=A0AAE1EX84_PETCI|nr:hypothetical protein Pcinc_030888 [Petrolisthes cinctipes]